MPTGDEMLAIAMDPARREAFFRARYKNMFMGRWIKHASLYPTWVTRLIHVDRARWERDVHCKCVGDGPAEASVRGTATDLLLLAARLEDADTLFFQRRLVLTGDVELGLTVRNLLERLPWESVPLGVRIGLNRGARLARAAREAHRGDAGRREFDRG